MNNKNIFISIFISLFFASFLLGAIIYPHYHGLYFCFSKTCLDYFVNYFGLPIKFFLSSITVSTLLFSFYRISLAQKSLDLQSKSFLYNSYQIQIESLYKFLLSAKENDLISIEPNDINMRRFFDFLYPSVLITGDFHDENSARKNIRNIIEEITEYSNRASIGKVAIDKKEYQKNIESILNNIGIYASIEDPRSAVASEKALKKLLRVIAEKWLSDCAIDLGAEHDAHHAIIGR